MVNILLQNTTTNSPVLKEILRSSIYIPNNTGKIIPPCFTPLVHL